MISCLFAYETENSTSSHIILLRTCLGFQLISTSILSKPSYRITIRVSTFRFEKRKSIMARTISPKNNEVCIGYTMLIRLPIGQTEYLEEEVDVPGHACRLVSHVVQAALVQVLGSLRSLSHMMGNWRSSGVLEFIRVSSELSPSARPGRDDAT